MPSALPILAALAHGLEFGRESNEQPVPAASTNARRQAEIGALSRLVMRWMVIFELVPVNRC